MTMLNGFQRPLWKSSLGMVFECALMATARKPQISTAAQLFQATAVDQRMPAVMCSR